MTKMITDGNNNFFKYEFPSKDVLGVRFTGY